MNQKILFLFLALLTCQSLAGQVMEGKVVDENGNALPDVYLLSPTGNQHTHTNALGRFRHTGFQAGDTLEISLIGFNRRMIILEKKDFDRPMTIELKETPIKLQQVIISSQINPISQIARIDVQNNPVNSAQELLRKVPGLFIAQHAGGGKAEQIFLRGFDIDHGTDINITVDGLPVNLVSHAHGQGYSDLHFMIPETVERLDFNKGPYFADRGNFTTAGYISFQTKDRLEKSAASMEYGRFNSFRTVGLFDLLPAGAAQQAYLAGEYVLTDGPFLSSQNFNRLNLMGKFTANLPGNDKLSVLAGHFTSTWDASGQIPQRAVEAGLISRFGAIDDTEGGSTSRTNLVLNHTRNLSEQSFLKSRVYFSRYDFELYSNFTFFLNDPENSDQIRQAEDRQLFGMESVYYRQFQAWGLDIQLRGGMGLRYDQIRNNELSRTANRRTTLNTLTLGDIDESNVSGFISGELEWGKFLFNPGIRFDYFKFAYVDRLRNDYRKLSENESFLSPKLNLLYTPNRYWQLFLKTGIGFHSNDTRVVVTQNGTSILPAAYGLDLGTVWKPIPRLWFNTALWYLFLEQEFVYVGDEAIVEPSGRTRRTGIDLGVRFQLSEHLFLDSDLNYAFARSVDEPEGADYIPLAPQLTATGGLVFQSPSGLSGGIRYRYIKNRPANESGSITALGYFLTDINANYQWKATTFSLIVDNVFNAQWNEAQFATLSRLRNEGEAVEELHFTPGMPIFVKGKISFSF